MCIIVINNGNLLSEDSFRRMVQSNPDGFGMMCHSVLKGVVHTYKTKIRTIEESTSVGAFNRELAGVYSDYVGYFNNPHFMNLVLHFRYATDGYIDVPNCHPFKYLETDLNKCYLMHNGIINKYRRRDRHSDTYHFVNDYLNFHDRSMKDIANEVEDSNKFVILKDGDYNIHTSDITKFRTLKDDGNIYSNLSWNWDYSTFNYGA